MPLNKQLQNVRNDIYQAELENTQEWTRAKVNECIISAVIMARQFSFDDERLRELLTLWPEDSSVRYEWFRCLATRPEVKFPSNQQPFINSIANILRVLAGWLHRVDSQMDRTVLILHACGLSYNSISDIYKDMRWTHNTLRRRHTQLLDSLVYDLNHIDELKWPAGISFWTFE